MPLSWLSFVSIYAIHSYAARLEEKVGQLDDTDVWHTQLVSNEGRPALVAEKFSPEDMQEQLLLFLAKKANEFPKMKYLNDQDNAFWREAKGRGYSCEDLHAAVAAEASDGAKGGKGGKSKKSQDDSLCKHLVGCLARNLRDACQIQIAEMDSDEAYGTCTKNVKDLFFQGEGAAQVVVVGTDVEKAKAPNKSKPLWKIADLLKQWVIPLATPEQAAILWAGFWTDASADGHKSRTSKERLKQFADLIEAQTVHPSTVLGLTVDNHDNLASCHGVVETKLRDNMWSFFSLSFILGMRKKKQDMVVALVHKELEGDRPLGDSVLFRYEMPAIGVAAWGRGFGFWSPQVVVIDLLGTCQKTGKMLREKLFSRLARSNDETEFQDDQDFVRRSRLSWTCLDCPKNRRQCGLDNSLAKQVKEILQAKREEDEKGTNLIKAAKEGDVRKVQELLLNRKRPRADENFQDEDGNTPLSFAVAAGDEASAKLLLKHDAHVDPRDAWGNTPLFNATEPKLQQLLLDKGANRSAKNFEGQTAKVAKI